MEQGRRVYQYTKHSRKMRVQSTSQTVIIIIYYLFTTIFKLLNKPNNNTS